MPGDDLAEQRRIFQSLLWTRPVLKFQVTVLAGEALFIGALMSSAYVRVTSPATTGFPSLFFDLFFLIFAALGVIGAGALARNATLRRLAYRECPICKSGNLITSDYCRKCGTSLGRSRSLMGISASTVESRGG